MQVLAYTGNEDGRKFVLEGEITLDSVKVCSLLTLEPNFWINPVWQIPDVTSTCVKLDQMCL